jgi:DNA-binding transcriptional MocR family regulator
VTRLLGSDIRLAFVAGDGETIGRVDARQAVTTSWVSRLLQEVVAETPRTPLRWRRHWPRGRPGAR